MTQIHQNNFNTCMYETAIELAATGNCPCDVETSPFWTLQQVGFEACPKAIFYYFAQEKEGVAKEVFDMEYAKQIYEQDNFP